MPSIGRPQNLVKNSFKDIKMAPRKEDVSARLNELTGKEGSSGIKYINAEDHNKMGKDEFLKLLTVQLSHQDPLKPVDQKQMAADLAQFSSLEQLSNMNNKLDNMNGNAPSEKKFYGASFLGKKVITSGTTIKLDSEKGPGPLDLPFALSKPARNILIRVMDKKGQTISEIKKENVHKGNHVLSWDGKSLDGSKAGDGDYSFRVLAWDENMSQFDGETKTQGLVTGVYFENGDTVLKVDGDKRIFLHDVESFLIPGNNKNNTAQKAALAAFKQSKEQ